MFLISKHKVKYRSNQSMWKSFSLFLFLQRRHGSVSAIFSWLLPGRARLTFWTLNNGRVCMATCQEEGGLFGSLVRVETRLYCPPCMGHSISPLLSLHFTVTASQIKPIVKLPRCPLSHTLHSPAFSFYYCF